MITPPTASVGECCSGSRDAARGGTMMSSKQNNILIRTLHKPGSSISISVSTASPMAA